MEKTHQKESYVVLEATYPHKLLLCLQELCDGNKQMIWDEDAFLRKFRERFPDETDEWKMLALAYEQNIIDGFFAAARAPEWRKRVVIKKSLRTLVGITSEYYAVALLESLMFLFRWDFLVKVERRWNVREEERACFHDKVEIRKDKSKKIPGGMPIRQDRSIPQKRRRVENAAEIDIPQEGNCGKTQTVGEAEDKMIGAERNSVELSGSPAVKGEDDSGESSIDVLAQKPEQVRFYDRMSVSERRVLRRALEGDVRSQCEMGAYYADSSGRHQDYREAIRWYEVAAERGAERALFEIGRIYDNNGMADKGGKEKALEIYERLANRGYPTAQCVLGMKYRLGDGVEESAKDAVKWLEKAALQGHAAAIRNLADLYQSFGETKRAQKWYHIGVKNGDDYCIQRSKGK